MRNIEKLFYENENGERIEFSTRSVYHVNDTNGLATIRNTVYSYESVGQDGAGLVGNKIEPRDIDITGRINVRHKEQAAEARRRLVHLLNPHLKARLVYEFGDFKRYIECTTVIAEPSRGTVLQDFKIQFTCLDPFWREMKETSYVIAEWTPLWKFPFKFPMQFGERSRSRIVDVFNHGDVDMGIKVRFKALGDVQNPRLLNVKTMAHIRVHNVNMNAGDVLEVNTNYGQKAVTLIKKNGERVNMINDLDFASVFMQLPVGLSQFSYDADVGMDKLDIRIVHDTIYLGV
jgi:hypothetical protein